MKTTRIEKLVSAYVARKACEENGNTEWFNRWDDVVNSIDPPIQDFKLLRVKDTSIVFTCSQYAVDEYGYHTGFIAWTVSLIPSFVHGFQVHIVKLSKPDDMSDFDADGYTDGMIDSVHHYFSEEVLK